jgi:hypothetical protein
MGFINQQTSLGGTILYWMVYDEHKNKESILLCLCKQWQENAESRQVTEEDGHARHVTGSLHVDFRNKDGVETWQCNPYPVCQSSASAAITLPMMVVCCGCTAVQAAIVTEYG